MPLELTWQTALVLVADGLLFGIGLALGQALLNGLLGLASRGRQP